MSGATELPEMTSKGVYSVYYQNVRGLRTKTETFYTNLLSQEYNMIGITESWLCESVLSSELFDYRYTVLRRDRATAGRGGGVVLAIDNSIVYESIDTKPNLECILIKIRNKSMSVYVSVVYFPPNSGLEMYESFFNMFEQILTCERGNVLILGDFNLPCYTGCDEKSRITREFLSVHDLRQVNEVNNFMGRRLDLVICSIETDVFGVEDPLVPEDRYHPALALSIPMGVIRQSEKHNKKKTYCYDFAKGDYLGLYESVRDYDWSGLLECNSVDVAVDLFYRGMYWCVDRAVPKYEVKQTATPLKFPLWYTVNLIRKIRKKNRLHKSMTRGTASASEEAVYRQLRKDISGQIRNEYRQYKITIQENINSDPSSFWSFVKSKSLSGGIPRTMKWGNNLFTTSSEIANAFARHFQSVHEQPDLSQCINHDCGGSFTFSEISEDDVLIGIGRLKPKRSTGCDNIPAYIYKGLAEYLAKPLAHIFNQSLRHNLFPEAMKEAIITPVHKKGSQNDIANYRPISLINIVAKIFESILYRDLFSEVGARISQSQHGFVPDKSTVTNLLELSEAAADAIDVGGQLDVIYTDCEKAFDKVNHFVLLGRLAEYGLSGGAYSFMKSYLTSRPHVVKVGRSHADPYVAASGVPQGSTLGPLLFILFINPMPDVLRNSAGLMFADDFKMFRSISCTDDHLKLQADLESVSQWFNANRMSVNVEKCCVVSFTRKRKILLNDYCIDGVKLVRRNEVKDLGVFFQCNMRFGTHYDYVCNKALRSLGFVMRNGRDFNINTVVRLYTALVRPHLEYAQQVWMPSTYCHIDQVERVQKRFLRYLYMRKNGAYPYMISYRSMVDSFNFTTLLNRRNRQAVILLYWIVNGTRFRDCGLINYVSFRVPKINLRILSADCFSVRPSSLSPVNYLMSIYNEVTKDIQCDIFCVSGTGLMKALLAGG